LTPIDRVEAVAKVQHYVAKDLGDGKDGAGVVGQSMSAVTFTPKLPGPTDYYTRQFFNERLTQERGELLKSDFFKIDQDDGSELWRISLRVAAFKGVDYGDFVKDLREVVEPVMTAYNVRYQLIQAAVERQAQGAPADGGGQIRVGLVLPDQLAKDSFPPPPPKKRASQKSKEAAEAVPEEDETDEQFVGVAINQDLILTQSLYGSLRAARVGVERIQESALNKEQLAGLDMVVLLGNLQSATKELVRANSPGIIDGKAILTEALAALNSNGEPAAAPKQSRTTSAVYTGVVPIVYKAQRTLLSSLVNSTEWSFLTITPVMILVAWNIRAGLVSMLPNALPVLVVFGAMGWMAIRVDIGSMMTASIALGVAVDDTIHFLTWFREELDRTKDRKLAILGAYKRCATPTLQAATISGLGLSIFAFSTFTPTQRFGYLMLAILFAGVVAELVFFPALLASPLGWVFKPRGKAQDGEAGSAESGESSEQPADAPVTVRIDQGRDTSKKIA
jgi:hypothetical protein